MRHHLRSKEVQEALSDQATLCSIQRDLDLRKGLKKNTAPGGNLREENPNGEEESDKEDKGPEEGEETRSQQAAHGPVHGP
jgi:hypothetical protein